MSSFKTILPDLNLAQPTYVVLIEYHHGNFDHHMALDFDDAQILVRHYKNHIDAYRISVFDFATHIPI